MKDRIVRTYVASVALIYTLLFAAFLYAYFH